MGVTATGAARGAATGADLGEATGVARGGATGAATGVALGAATGVARGGATGAATGVALGAATGVLGHCATCGLQKGLQLKLPGRLQGSQLVPKQTPLRPIYLLVVADDGVRTAAKLDA